MSDGKLWIKTPLVRSSALSERLDAEVYLKIETFQKGRSFKGRGIPHFANQAIRAFLHHAQSTSISAPSDLDTDTDTDTKSIAAHAALSGSRASPAPAPAPTMMTTGTATTTRPPPPHLVVASGGNAGIAAAAAARELNVRCTVFLPVSAVDLVGVLRGEGPPGGLTDVRIGGENYAEALGCAERFKAELGPCGILVPAFDDPLVWQGNATLIHEIEEDLPRGLKPDAIVCAVGGGGLIGGIALGAEDVGWEDVLIVGVETHGSACFYHSVQATRGDKSRLPPGTIVKEATVQDALQAYSIKRSTRQDEAIETRTVKVAHLASLSSRATSLGASSPAPSVVPMALHRKGAVRCMTVSDERAMEAALRFADDEKIVPELATAAALVPAYMPRLLEGLLPQQQGPRQRRVVVFVVCGGTKAYLKDLEEYRDTVASWDREADLVYIDGAVV